MVQRYDGFLPHLLYWVEDVCQSFGLPVYMWTEHLKNQSRQLHYDMACTRYQNSILASFFLSTFDFLPSAQSFFQNTPADIFAQFFCIQLIFISALQGCTVSEGTHSRTTWGGVDDYAPELLPVLMKILLEKTSFSLCFLLALFLAMPNINLHDTDNSNNWYRWWEK